MQILTSPQCLPFVVALGLVVALTVLQAVLLSMGGTLELDSDADLDADIDTDGGVLHWLGLGELPLSLWLIVASLSFGAIGLLLQLAMRSITGSLLNATTASLIASPVALVVSGLCSRALVKVLPREESEAVSHESFVGCEGVITTGMARLGRPAEARVRDKYGRAHYVMVEPQDEAQQFASGASVLLLKRDGEKYRVIDGTGATE